MLFSRSRGLEFKTTHGHLFIGFGNLYTGDPTKKQSWQMDAWMWMCKEASWTRSLVGQVKYNTSDFRSKFNIPQTPAMPVIPTYVKNRKILQQLDCCGGGFDLVELCKGCSLPGFMRISTPLWLRRLIRCFTLDPGVSWPFVKRPWKPLLYIQYVHPWKY